jgi:hypothetical protein
MGVLNNRERENDINTGTLILTKADGSNLIDAPGYYHILAIVYQPANELVNSDSFTF